MHIQGLTQSWSSSACPDSCFHSTKEKHTLAATAQQGRNRDDPRNKWFWQLLGMSPGRRQWQPTQYSCLENPMDGGAARLQSRGREESDTTEQLHFSLSCIGEGNGKPLLCSCLENPKDGGAWWAAVYGVTQSRTRLKRLSSSNRNVPQIPLLRPEKHKQQDHHHHPGTSPRPMALLGQIPGASCVERAASHWAPA